MKGYYNTVSRIAYFKEKVVGVGENFKIESDTLHYHTLDKRAVFIGPTYLTNKDGKLYTEKGEYNTETEVSKFESRTSVVQKEYILTADKITYDKKRNLGNASGNVHLTSLKDTVVVLGNKAIYKGNIGYTKVYENVLVKMKNGIDTLLLKTDTLIYVSDSLKKQKYISAFPKAKLFKEDIQGICDSLVYNQFDSTIYMYKQPTLWAQKSQMNADSIRLQMVNNRLDKMYLRKNAIVISEDSIKNHNQVKGKNMLAHFKENKIQKVDVNGNGESVYFATENDTLLVGMNRIACSNMVIRFKENQINTFTFLQKPEARFVPEHEIVEPDKFLKGYSWRINEIPRKEEMAR
ncbi:MAG: OstA-like protein [Cytophagales bacterium]